MKKITYFTIQFRLKKLIHFRNLNSFEIKNNMLPKHSQKTSSFYKFPGKYVSVWCEKKLLLCTISWRPITTLLKLFESKYLYFSVNLSKRFLFERGIKILSGGLGDFLKTVCCLGLVKCFTIFHFN